MGASRALPTVGAFTLGEREPIRRIGVPKYTPHWKCVWDSDDFYGSAYDSLTIFWDSDALNTVPNDSAILNRG